MKMKQLMEEISPFIIQLISKKIKIFSFTFIFKYLWFFPKRIHIYRQLIESHFIEWMTTAVKSPNYSLQVPSLGEPCILWVFLNSSSRIAGQYSEI
jgi:hypothetical protein